MRHEKVMMTPEQVANTFENVFVDKMDIKPSALGLDKDTSTDLSMDSLDCLEVVMELETKFGVRIPQNEYPFVVGNQIYNFLDVCVQSLVKSQRLSPADAMIVRTQYPSLIHSGKSGSRKKSLKQTPTLLSKKYQNSVAQKQALAQQVQQNQK